MFGYFDNSNIRKYVVIFGTLFNDMKITRKDANNNILTNINVPLSYAPKEKILQAAKNRNLTEGEKPVAIVLPRMSFEIVNIFFDPMRRSNPLAKKMTANGDYYYNPVPYNITFELNILTHSQYDATQLVEQILPYFQPDYNLKAKFADDMNDPVDINIVLEDVNNVTNSYDGALGDRQEIIWTLTFTLKAYLYGKKKTGEFIRFTEVSIKNNSNTLMDPMTPKDMIIKSTPGLTANGEPTTNAAESIDYMLINPDDNYGFIVEFDGE